MKTTVLTTAITLLTTFLSISCTTSANAQTSQFFYNKDGNSTTVYTSEDGRILNRKLKYEYRYDEQGTVIEKKAYKWNSINEKWEPKYIINVDYNLLETKMNYAEWNSEKDDFSKNVKQTNYSLYSDRLITDIIK